MLSTLLLLQSDVNISVGSPISGVLGGAVTAFLTTLVVGAIVLAIRPEYVRQTAASFLDDLVGSLVYGVIGLVGVACITFLLVITLIGIPLAVLFVLLAYLLWAVGAAIAFFAIGERLVDRPDEPLVALAVGAGINGALVLTGIGSIVALCIGAGGFGAVVRRWLE
ncbi:hypothetical protein SAMN06269185_0193 [Natronoarchaeum philippinense]|uniref:DUF8173 domain-containing protein n=1 Tax=Natronoarchaeum philippinense TaxID=558529 RepID=A0A285N0Z8_NATPI|nr:hypothetical protein [Natronoarchaeum philippinense]SNZ03110.1 hypothetical protein SAMN06269185_0193 [Natronoarchaeum philippinense]